jgi:hydrogenase expression/formation protein HypD
VRFVTEYRDPALCDALVSGIAAAATRPWTLMEICGGQTHTIARYALEELLPGIGLVHGPGCPVCVTPAGIIDAACSIARSGGVLCTFGDMLRVPGSVDDLMSARASGADVRMVYSPLDAVGMAADEQGREFVFLAIGFETTAPVTAAAVLTAEARGLGNFSIIPAHVLVPPALESVLSSPGGRIDAVLAAGHVCAVQGYAEYEPIADRHRVPVVVTGFEPADILQGVLMAVRQLESGTCRVENQYSRAVARTGSPGARALVERVYRITDRHWRGLGPIAGGGLTLAQGYASFDALRRFGLTVVEEESPSDVPFCGRVLSGSLDPLDCPAFGTDCTPEHPMGAPMVSGEGACAARRAYGGHRR